MTVRPYGDTFTLLLLPQWLALMISSDICLHIAVALTTARIPHTDFHCLQAWRNSDSQPLLQTYSWAISSHRIIRLAPAATGHLKEQDMAHMSAMACNDFESFIWIWWTDVQISGSTSQIALQLGVSHYGGILKASSGLYVGLAQLRSLLRC